MRFVLDTNTIIYIQKGRLAEVLPLGNYFASIITEIELLSFPGLIKDDEAVLRELLSDIVVIPVDATLKDIAIRWRRDHRLKMPDAIVTATAEMLDAQLLTNDTALHNLPGVFSRRLALKS